MKLKIILPSFVLSLLALFLLSSTIVVIAVLLDTSSLPWLMICCLSHDGFLCILWCGWLFSNFMMQVFYLSLVVVLGMFHALKFSCLQNWCWIPHWMENGQYHYVLILTSCLNFCIVGSCWATLDPFILAWIGVGLLLFKLKKRKICSHAWNVFWEHRLLMEIHGSVLTYVIHDSCKTAFSWPHMKFWKVVKCSGECCDITHPMKIQSLSDSCLCIDSLCLTAVNRSSNLHDGIPMMSGKYDKYQILHQ